MRAREGKGAHDYVATPTTHAVDTMCYLPSTLDVILSRLRQVPPSLPKVRSCQHRQGLRLSLTCQDARDTNEIK